MIIQEIDSIMQLNLIRKNGQGLGDYCFSLFRSFSLYLYFFIRQNYNVKKFLISFVF